MRDTTAPESAEPQLIRARRGVILACGGFERNEQMRVKYQRAPIGVAYPSEMLVVRIWEEDGRLVATVTAPTRDDEPVLSGVELIPA